MNVETLILLCLKQDRAAQKQLYDNYKDSLYTIAYRMTQDFDLASDILQEAFIEAFKQLPNLREPKYFHSWIKQILIRKAYRQLDKQKDKVSLDTVDEIKHEVNVDIGYIEQAIHTLPLKSRTVFIMAEIEGFKHKEIATALDITEGTSKSQLNYAKTKLKELLKHHLV